MHACVGTHTHSLFFHAPFLYTRCSSSRDALPFLSTFHKLISPSNSLQMSHPLGRFPRLSPLHSSSAEVTIPSSVPPFSLRHTPSSPHHTPNYSCVHYWWWALWGQRLCPVHVWVMGINWVVTHYWEQRGNSLFSNWTQTCSWTPRLPSGDNWLYSFC